MNQEPKSKNRGDETCLKARNIRPGRALLQVVKGKRGSRGESKGLPPPPKTKPTKKQHRGCVAQGEFDRGGRGDKGEGRVRNDAFLWDILGVENLGASQTTQNLAKSSNQGGGKKKKEVAP